MYTGTEPTMAEAEVRSIQTDRGKVGMTVGHQEEKKRKRELYKKHKKDKGAIRGSRTGKVTDEGKQSTQDLRTNMKSEVEQGRWIFIGQDRSMQDEGYRVSGVVHCIQLFGIDNKVTLKSAFSPSLVCLIMLRSSCTECQLAH